MYQAQLEQLMDLSAATMRSADRANIKAMLRRVAKGQDLTYQEMQNLWAYCNRYGVQVAMKMGH